MILYTDELKRRATIYRVRFGRSLRSAIGCPLRKPVEKCPYDLSSAVSSNFRRLDREGEFSPTFSSDVRSKFSRHGRHSSRELRRFKCKSRRYDSFTKLPSRSKNRFVGYACLSVVVHSSRSRARTRKAVLERDRCSFRVFFFFFFFLTFPFSRARTSRGTLASTFGFWSFHELAAGWRGEEEEESREKAL